MEIPTITVEQLKALRDAKTAHILLDVRETSEYETAKIAGSTLIPMGEVPKRCGELKKDAKIIVHCHHGGRSARVTGYLLQNGFKDVCNLEGGIDAWSDRVDPSVCRY